MWTGMTMFCPNSLLSVTFIFIQCFDPVQTPKSLDNVLYEMNTITSYMK